MMDSVNCMNGHMLILSLPRDWSIIYTSPDNQLTGLLPLMVFCPSLGSTCSHLVPTNIIFAFPSHGVQLPGLGRVWKTICFLPLPCELDSTGEGKGPFHFLPDSSRLCCWSSKGFLLLFDDFFSRGVLLRKPAAEPRQAVISEALPTYAVREQGLVVFLMHQVCM